MNIQTRIKIEHQVVRKLIRVLLDAGYSLSAGIEGEADIENSTDKKALFDAITACDEMVVWPIRDGKKQGMVFLVFGNSGYDLINDYSTRLETVLSPVNQYCDILEERHG